MNIRVACLAVNSLFTENPAKDPALAKVLQSMGLDGKKNILHREHPVLFGLEERRPLCPPDTRTDGLLHDSLNPVKVQFTGMLGKFYFIFIHTLLVYLGYTLLNFFVVCLDRASSLN